MDQHASEDPEAHGAAQLVWDERLLRNLVANVPGAIYRCEISRDWDMRFISAEIERITGFPADDFVDSRVRTYASVIHPDDHELVERTVGDAVQRGEPFVVEYRVVRADGGVRWVHEQGRAVDEEDGSEQFLDGAIFDITDRKRLEEQLQHLAYHDALTGLPNRVLFNDQVELGLARGRRFSTGLAVLFVDLDDFKLVNDSFGHAVGDELLREVAERLVGAVRETDVVARQGGDEFLVLLADLPAAGGEEATSAAAQQAAAAAAQRIHDALDDPVRLGGTEVHVRASIGISAWSGDEHGAQELLKAADAAMYRAKQAGRDGRDAAIAGPDEARRRLSLASRLRRAIDNRQFELHYQPLVELRDGRMLGVEALIRWHDPDHGMVLPGEFIPLAERTGLIVPISEWVVAEACRQASAWQSAGLDLYVSVNLPTRFWQPAPMRSVLDTIESFGISPTRLMVEITESAAMRHPEQGESMIDELRRRGLRVAIDDFGTGHSSLARINQLSVTTLKIDRSFVGDIPGDAGAGLLVSGIVQLARSLGLEPVAEGIETDAQRTHLLEYGCRLGQGFLFSAALPADEVARYRPA